MSEANAENQPDESEGAPGCLPEGSAPAEEVQAPGMNLRQRIAQNAAGAFNAAKRKKNYIIPIATFVAGAAVGYAGHALISGNSAANAPDSASTGGAVPERTDGAYAGIPNSAYFFNKEGQFVIPNILEGIVIGEHAKDYKLRQVLPVGVIGTVETEGMSHSDSEMQIDRLKKAKLPGVYIRAFSEAREKGYDGFVVQDEVVKSGSKATLEAKVFYHRGVE